MYQMFCVCSSAALESCEDSCMGLGFANLFFSFMTLMTNLCDR